METPPSKESSSTNPGASTFAAKEPASRSARMLLVVLGIVLGQAILYGPSLLGYKVLLPLDILTEQGVYVPRTPEVASIRSQNHFLSDLVLLMEPVRRFGATELQAGRLPMWMPGQYAGVPFIEPRFSPFFLLECCTTSPRILPWAQLLAALVAGTGAYWFLRKAIALSYWPAALAAWCYPLTAFFIFWQGYSTGNAVYWLPWLLLGVDQTARGTSRWAPVGLSVATVLTVVSGHLDVGGQVLLGSGLYGLWRWWMLHRSSWRKTPARKAALGLLAGWSLGLCLAAPYVLPMVEYARTGARLERRVQGGGERPPEGLVTLPQVLLPDLLGSSESDSYRFSETIQLESAAAAYTGAFAVVLLVPLAWSSRGRRAQNIFWLFLGLFGLSWCLNLPGIVNLLRLPGLTLMSHNRLTFLTCFSILVMAATGLEALVRGEIRWQQWAWFPLLLASGLSAYWAYRACSLPAATDFWLERAFREATKAGAAGGLSYVQEVRASFVKQYALGALWCGLGAVAWWILWWRRSLPSRSLPLLGLAFVGELIGFAHGRNVQSDPALYYPPIPVLKEVAHATPGRVMGYGCLPAQLAEVCGLRDVRGYDGVDPERMVTLLLSAADSSSRTPYWAMTQWLVPGLTPSENGNVRLPPILSMLGVRYVIFRNSPPANVRPAFQGFDYWVMANPDALERVFVPRRIEVAAESQERLRKLASPDFDPKAVAYLETPVALPPECSGTARVVSETPTRVTVSVQMETPGMVVLADRWDQGWKSYVNGESKPIVRVNHAVRGVVMPAGTATIEFRYEPASFARGLRIAGLALLVLVGYMGLTLRGQHSTKSS